MKADYPSNKPRGPLPKLGQLPAPARIQRELSGRLRELTNNGQDVVDFVMAIFKDQSMPMRERIWAFTWIADRIWGKAPENIEIVHSGAVTHEVKDAGIDWSRYTPDELRTMIALLEKGDLQSLPPPASASQSEAEDAEFEEVDAS